MRFRSTLSLAALAAALALTPAIAQKRQPTPEQRIDRLEKQVRQVQKQVFPKGQPADTAGFSDDPAATQDSVSSLTGRLDAIERQLSDIVRQSEENGNRVAAVVGKQCFGCGARLPLVEQGPAGEVVCPAGAAVIRIFLGGPQLIAGVVGGLRGGIRIARVDNRPGAGGLDLRARRRRR